MWDHLPAEALTSMNDPLEALVSMKTCGSWRRTLHEIRQQPEVNHEVAASLALLDWPTPHFGTALDPID